MFRLFKEKISTVTISLAVLVMSMMLVGVLTTVSAQAAEYSASLSTDRTDGKCTYTVNGIDLSTNTSMTAKVTYTDSTGNVVTALEQQISLDSSNCSNGSYTGSFSMTDLASYTYANYKVSFVMGGTQEEVTASDTCDFSIHTDKYTIEASGNKSDVNRTFSLVSTESADDVIVPGSGNQVKLLIWKNGQSEDTAVTVGSTRDLTNVTRTWDVDLSTLFKSYGTYNAKMVLVNSNLSGGTQSLGLTNFKMAVTYSGIGSVKTKALEKKKAFRVYVARMKSALGIQKVTFELYDSNGKKVYTKNGTHNSTSTYYYANIGLKALSYNLEKYSIKVIVTDTVGNKRTLSGTGVADETVKSGTLKVVKFSNATCKFRLKNAYIPGNIKNVRFNVYSVKNGKKTFYKKYIGVYTSAKSLYIANMQYTSAGKFVVYAYGTTQWGKTVLLKSANFRVKKSELGKNGWTYEKYAGKVYKFYYSNNKKVTDLTNILNLKKGNNKLYIEINRAACTVTIYAYDSQRKAYIIPVITCTVSVGRDTYSTGSASALGTSTSFTPLGSYSICSNGTASKYTLKTMNEPDGSVCYARWASHIVGNVYFHAVAVGGQSHYSLSATSYNKLGSAASAGCIRMTVADAKWIYDYAAVGSKVKIVKGNSSKPGPLGKNATIKISSSVSYDPTDPAVPNSTKRKDYKAGKISGYMTNKGKKIGY